MSKRGKRRRGRRPRSRGGRQSSPGWHLKLEEFRREALGKSPEVVTRADMRGWELHLAFKPGHHQCSVCAWSGDSDADCPDCGSNVAPEPWSLVAHPCRENNDYTWLGKAAEFLGAPPEDKPDKPAKGEKNVVMFSWADKVPANPLGGV